MCRGGCGGLRAFELLRPCASCCPFTDRVDSLEEGREAHARLASGSSPAIYGDLEAALRVP